MMKSEAYIGKDSIRKLGPILQKCGAKHVFLVRGKNSYKTCGAEEIINRIVLQTGCVATDFFDFSANPKCEDLERGLELLKNCGADCIIAVGGGSVIDMAKLIRFFHSYSGEVTGKCFEKQKDLLPLVAMPTTSGTGAETTPFSVIYKNKVKYSAEHDGMLPDYAIIYPPFTYNNPKYLTACTGFDALAQAIEAYWNINATNESDFYSERAISLIWENLFKAVNEPNYDIRDIISEGAYYAGKAIGITRTTAPHAFSYAFMTYCGLPHGHAVALTFPFFAELNMYRFDEANLQNPNCIKTYAMKMERLRNMLGLYLKTIYSQMQVYLEHIGLGNTLKNMTDVRKLLSMVNLQRLGNNPVKISNIEILSLGDLLQQ